MEGYFPEILHLASTNNPPETSLRTHDIALCPPGAFPGSTPFFRLLLLCPDDIARPETSHRIEHLHRLDQGRNAAIIFLVDEDVTKGATLAFTKLQIELSPPSLTLPIPPLTTNQHPPLPPTRPPPHSPRPPGDPPDIPELTGPLPREPVPSQSGRHRRRPHPALRRWGPAHGPDDRCVDQLVPQRQGRRRGVGGGGGRGSAGGGAGRG